MSFPEIGWLETTMVFEGCVEEKIVYFLDSSKDVFSFLKVEAADSNRDKKYFKLKILNRKILSIFSY
jgi:hypothetical protein